MHQLEKLSIGATMFCSKLPPVTKNKNYKSLNRQISSCSLVVAVNSIECRGSFVQYFASHVNFFSISRSTKNTMKSLMFANCVVGLSLSIIIIIIANCVILCTRLISSLGLQEYRKKCAKKLSAGTARKVRMHFGFLQF